MTIREKKRLNEKGEEKKKKKKKKDGMIKFLGEEIPPFPDKSTVVVQIINNGKIESQRPQGTRQA